MNTDNRIFLYDEIIIIKIIYKIKYILKNIENVKHLRRCCNPARHFVEMAIAHLKMTVFLLKNAWKIVLFFTENYLSIQLSIFVKRKTFTHTQRQRDIQQLQHLKKNKWKLQKL